MGQHTYTAGLLILLRAQASVGVRNTNGELLCTLDDLLALSARNVVCNLGRECPVLHQKHFKLLHGNVTKHAHTELHSITWWLLDMHSTVHFTWPDSMTGKMNMCSGQLCTKTCANTVCSNVLSHEFLWIWIQCTNTVSYCWQTRNVFEQYAMGARLTPGKHAPGPLYHVLPCWILSFNVKGCRHE